MESEEKGRGELSKGGGRTPAPRGRTLRPGYSAVSRPARPVCPAAHDGTADGWSPATSNWLPTRGCTARPIRSTPASRWRAAVWIWHSGLPAESVWPRWAPVPAAAMMIPRTTKLARAYREGWLVFYGAVHSAAFCIRMEDYAYEYHGREEELLVGFSKIHGGFSSLWAFEQSRFAFVSNAWRIVEGVLASL